MALKSISYSIVDVFTNKTFCGNQLAVIHDAQNLDKSEMLNIAREFGFAETTFILPPKDKTHTANIRIFTTSEEIPFAGHPNIGTAFVIATQPTAAMIEDANRYFFEEEGGLVSVNLLHDDQHIVGAKIKVPQSLSVLGDCDIELIANCLSLSYEDISASRFNPCVASVGLPFAFVELKALSSLEHLDVDISSFKQAKTTGPQTVDGFSICAFVITNENSNHLDIRSRVLSPFGQPHEDPATGSASAALGELINRSGKEDSYHINIKQGVEIGRPSTIIVDVNKSAPAEISGNCVNVSTGVITL